MLASVENVRVLQKITREYEGNKRNYILLGDGKSDVLKFRVDDQQVFDSLQPFDMVKGVIDLYIYDGRMYSAVKFIQKEQ